MNTTFSAIKIVTLNKSCWQATRMHRAETNRVNEQNHTEAARVTVKLCQHPVLTSLRALHAEIYQKHIKMTRPSIQDGLRLLPVGREFDHMEMAREARIRHDQLVSCFLADYDDERLLAPSRLNGLYDPAMWPTHAQIEAKFDLRVQYLGCPSDPSWQDWIKESSLAATSDLCDAIENAIEHIAARCESDGKLHQSVFQNLRDLLKEVPQYDCKLDARLIRLAAQAEYLSHHQAEELREMPASRKQTAQEARSILDGSYSDPDTSRLANLFPVGSL